MSQDVSAGAGDGATAGAGPAPEPPAVVEWGGDPPAANRRASRLLGGLRADRRVAPIVAGLGAVAAAGSVLSEWQVRTLRESAEAPVEEFATSVIGLPAVGTAYLIGALVLAACLTLTFFGTGPVRYHARLVGLATAGVQAVVLIAAVTQLEEAGGVLDDVVFRQVGPGGEATLRTGRGVYLAFAGVGALALALWLAGSVARAAPWRRTAAAPGPGGDIEVELDGGAAGDDEFGPDWPWRRRPPAARTDDLQRPAPLDLTVEPASPFVSPPDERDSR